LFRVAICGYQNSVRYTCDDSSCCPFAE
jgi:hypothetical protein